MEDNNMASPFGYMPEYTDVFDLTVKEDVGYQQKLDEALAYLGDKYLLAKPVKRITPINQKRKGANK